MHKLVFKSQVKSSEVLADLVCSEVLPSIRKTGWYNGNYHYRKDDVTKEEVEQFADGREDRLPFDVVKHIMTRCPDSLLLARLGGGHFTTLHARMDATSKGSNAGQPDLTVIRGLPNGFHGRVSHRLSKPKRNM